MVSNIIGVVHFCYLAKQYFSPDNENSCQIYSKQFVTLLTKQYQNVRKRNRTKVFFQVNLSYT
jgi:hypothetical protein